MTSNREGAAMVIGKGFDDGLLDLSEAGRITEQALKDEDFDGKSVLAVIPDNTRSGPLKHFFRLFCDLLLPRTKKLDFLVALGTHAPMSEDALLRLVGLNDPEVAKRCVRVKVMNHRWDKPESFRTAGVIPSSEVRELSGGLLEREVTVAVNKLVFDYDRVIIWGPVFPHEVAGFSGGYKYFFPGIAGREIIDLTHWLGALITSMEIIGVKDTPVRRVIERASSLMGLSTLCFCPVVSGERDLAGLFAGDPVEAWSAAADLSARVHVVRLEQPVKKALAVMPRLYDDLWTGAKGMYKLEPVIADRGEVIIYAPHIREVSFVHGRLIDEIGYHVRDYFVEQWDRFKEFSWCVLAHSTHVRGSGTFKRGKERPRIKVTLATGIPRERCERINLGYRDPASIDPEKWKEKEGVLFVPRAGEMLYRLAPEKTAEKKGAERKR